MAQVVVTIRIMPQSPEVDLARLDGLARKEIVNFCNSEEFKTSIEPIAFGLKALNIIFVMAEDRGSTEQLEHKISQIQGIESVQVTDVRRAIG